ncbi:MAG TPA: hypothetical protein VGQ19_16450 [Burkholderiales bacterium]|jgi:hypothetical protein|nr:hypothetical protein [Burkholderiales bacterium]
MRTVDAEFRRSAKDGPAVAAGTRQCRRAFLAKLRSRAVLVLTVRAFHLELLTRFECKAVFQSCAHRLKPHPFASLDEIEAVMQRMVGTDFRSTAMTGEHALPPAFGRLPRIPGFWSNPRPRTRAQIPSAKVFFIEAFDEIYKPKRPRQCDAHG